MTFRPDHELHRRRRGRNWGLGIVLITFVGLVYGLSLVKSLENGMPVTLLMQTGAMPAGPGAGQ